MNKPVTLGASAVITIILISFTSAFALEEFTSSGFGFSINYPENWIVEDEVVDFGSEPGFDEGFWSIVYFYDDPNFITDSIEVTFVKSDNIAKNNQGQKYLDRVESRLAENCEIAIMGIDGFECSNFLVIDAEITEHNGLPAYKFTQTWTESYPDGTSLELKSVLIDIIDGNDVWTIDGISIESEFTKFSPTFDEVIDSFTLLKTGQKADQEITCGEGTILKGDKCVVDDKNSNSSSQGGCLIATAAYGSELALQVQELRELRDNKLLQTESGSAFMESFNDFYYSFSPTIADYERENPVFREGVKLVITPMVSSLSILNHVDMETNAEVLGYGISLILLNVGMYVGVPIAIVVSIRKNF